MLVTEKKHKHSFTSSLYYASSFPYSYIDTFLCQTLSAVLHSDKRRNRIKTLDEYYHIRANITCASIAQEILDQSKLTNAAAKKDSSRTTVVLLVMLLLSHSVDVSDSAPREIWHFSNWLRLMMLRRLRKYTNQ